MSKQRDSLGRFDGRATTPMLQRFESRIHPEPNTGCWLFEGSAKNQYGHAAFKLGARNTPVVYAHRLAYELYVGPIDSGKHVLHGCDVPCCVNPAHLRLGTAKDNMQDAVARKRNKFGERAYNALLTEEQARQIKRGLTTREAARLFGVSRQAAADCKYGRTWKHIQ